MARHLALGGHTLPSGSKQEAQSAAEVEMQTLAVLTEGAGEASRPPPGGPLYLPPTSSSSTVPYSKGNNVYVNPLDIEAPLQGESCATHYPSPCSCVHKDPPRPGPGHVGSAGPSQLVQHIDKNQGLTATWQKPHPGLPHGPAGKAHGARTGHAPRYQRQTTMSSAGQKVANISAVGLALKRAFRRSKNPLARRLNGKNRSCSNSVPVCEGVGAPGTAPRPYHARFADDLQTHTPVLPRSPAKLSAPRQLSLLTPVASSSRGRAPPPPQPATRHLLTPTHNVSNDVPDAPPSLPLAQPPLQRAASSTTAPSPKIPAIRRSASASSSGGSVPSSKAGVGSSGCGGGGRFKRGPFSSSSRMHASPATGRKLANYHHLISNSKSGMHPNPLSFFFLHIKAKSTNLFRVFTCK